MTTLLQIERLEAGYGRSPVVRGLTMRVDEGEIVSLLGPNGAGKTTTLLTVSGLLRPLGGEVRLFGSVVDARSPHRNALRGLAHVTENRSLFAALTVRDNVRLAARGRRDTPDVVRYFPALDGLMGRKAGLLSGGEQQMLAIARAIVTRPRLLLIDEMSLGLAPVIVEQLAPIIRQIVDDTGVGVVLVEQHVPVALAIADRAVVLRHGRVVLSGTAAELAQDPELLHASYLGADQAVAAS